MITRSSKVSEKFTYIQEITAAGHDRVLGIISAKDELTDIIEHHDAAREFCTSAAAAPAPAHLSTTPTVGHSVVVDAGVVVVDETGRRAAFRREPAASGGGGEHCGGSK